MDDGTAFGFLKEQVGYCLMMFTQDEEEKSEEISDSPETIQAEAVTTDNAPAVSVKRNKVIRFYAVARGHVVGIFYTNRDAREAYSGYSDAKHKSFKTRAEAEKFLEEHKDPVHEGVTTGMPVAVASYVGTKANKKKKRVKNYGWTLKGTKKSRRKAKAVPVNEITAEHVYVRENDNNRDTAEVIKRLARTGGIKDLSGVHSVPVVDLTTGHLEVAARSTASPPVVFSGRHNSLKVKTKRAFAPNYTTTIHHPQRISKYAVDREESSTEEEVQPQPLHTLTLKPKKPSKR